MMCLAIPGQVVQLLEDDGDYAVVDVLGVRRKINISLLRHEDVQSGDWVLIHVGFAMSKISKDYAEEQLHLLTVMGEEQGAVREIRGYRFDNRELSEVPDGTDTLSGRSKD
jgi:hydrogenase expression/formation protein HypC